MSTLHAVATLFQLQQFDLEIERLLAEQQALQTSLQNAFPLKKTRQDQQKAQQQLASGLRAQRDAEAVLEELERRLKQQEQRLYSGSVTNAKELAALQQEIQHIRLQQSQQEETVLQMMDASEALHEAVALKTQAIHEAEQAWQIAHASADAKHEQLETKLQELRTRRAELAATLDAELVKRYEGMRKTKQGRVISKVEQNSCQWCRVILTPSELQRVRVSSDLQICSNCGRILYYDR